MHVDGYASAIVDNGYGVVFVDRYVYFLCEACKGFVDAVVNHFVYEVVQAFFGNVADIHRRALTDGFEPFEHLDITGAVFLFFFCHIRLLNFAYSTGLRSES